MDLKDKKCVPCKGMEPKLTLDEINGYLGKMEGWEFKRNPDKIIKRFEFKDFKQALEFVNSVGELAESEGHHPNICLHDYKNVKLELWTHKIKGLHENDFILAAKIDEILSWASKNPHSVVK